MERVESGRLSGALFQLPIHIHLIRDREARGSMEGLEENGREEKPTCIEDSSGCPSLELMGDLFLMRSTRLPTGRSHGRLEKMSGHGHLKGKEEE